MSWRKELLLWKRV